MTSEFERALASRVGRRQLLRYGAVLGGAGLLAAACRRAEETTGTGSSPGATTRPPIEEEPGTLQVFDWDGYGNGTYGDDVLWKAYAQSFPDAEPRFVVFKDDDSGYAKVAAGARYDLVHPCGYRWQDWVNLGVLQPWDTSLIPTFGELNPSLQQAGQFDGRQYFVAADWGFAAPMWDADRVEPAADSWEILWDDRYGGRISWWDSLNMLVVAGYVHGVADPWAMTDEELGEMRDFLISKKSLVRTFWPIDPTEDFTNGDVWITYAWPSHWVTATGAGVNAVYGNPTEGRTSWYCGFGLFADSENYHHAHEYVAAWTSARSGLWLLNNYGYGHTNTSIDLSKVDPALVEAFSLDDPTVLEEPQTHVERPIARRDVYQGMWDEVKAA
jgi:spermidine/putrescine transport system substrate-binding protein